MYVVSTASGTKAALLIPLLSHEITLQEKGERDQNIRTIQKGMGEGENGSSEGRGQGGGEGRGIYRERKSCTAT